MPDYADINIYTSYPDTNIYIPDTDMIIYTPYADTNIYIPYSDILPYTDPLPYLEISPYADPPAFYFDFAPIIESMMSNLVDMILGAIMEVLPTLLSILGIYIAVRIAIQLVTERIAGYQAVDTAAVHYSNTYYDHSEKQQYSFLEYEDEHGESQSGWFRDGPNDRTGEYM